MIDLIEFAGQRPGTRIEKIDIRRPFIDLAAGFASTPGTVLLMSGGDLDCARYHILGIKPWLSLTGRGHRMSFSSHEKMLDFEADPFDVLRNILKTYPAQSSSFLPLTSGLMGYFAYDLKDHIEKLPRTSIDDLGLPDICLFAPSIIIIQDKKDGSVWMCYQPKTRPGSEDPVKWLEHIASNQKSVPTHEKTVNRGYDNFKPNMTKDEYITSIEKIRGYITSGDVYQVNFAQRFESEFTGDPFELFRNCFIENPSSFFAYINAGGHQIISTSPERFIHRDNMEIETRPVKGTRPRGKSTAEDQAFKNELINSKKDEAELSMIVDLLRNDLGKVCESGSIHIAEHKRMEEYQNVFHMVSIIKGRLESRYDSIDLIRATFPGGSITGCPKIRAMEIIDELEPNRRHVYTGSIGYLSFHDTMDLSIAIRTAVIYNKKMFFSVGGGIVYDSNPSEEYDETLHKGKTFLNDNDDKNVHKNKEMAWINGMIRPLDQAGIKISDLGFHYGYGFFETIKFSGGVPRYLDEHIKRFNRAWKELFKNEVPDLSWEKIISQVVDANMLKDTVASIKIIASWGSRMEPPYDHSLVVTAKPYVHRLSGNDTEGLRLATYPFPRQTPLADHKTLNYAYYYLSGKWARENGADEAIIINPDYSISETNTASIFVIKGEKAIRPLSAHSLPGIMEERVSDLLASLGYNLEKKVTFLEDLFVADNVFITNSLIGAVPVNEIDGKAVKISKDICKKLNDMLL
jgi:para-aminobenzoate synthetase component I